MINLRLSSTERTNSIPRVRTNARAPFFSVLIPTMNRPQLCAAAIRTVMWQSFDDFELIVSDNCTTEADRRRTHEAAQAYHSDARLRYIRPDSFLNMPDHWEFLSRQATGRYLLILTDRFVMRPSALEFLHAHIQAASAHDQVICWHPVSCFDERSGRLITTPFSGNTRIWKSKDMARAYADYRLDRLCLPRLMNSCCRADLAATVRQAHGRFFHPVAPDDTAAMLQLAYSDNVTYIDRPLYVSHGNQSNGREVVLRGHQCYTSTLGDSVDVFAHVPCTIDCVQNLMIRDMLAIKSLVGDRLADLKLNCVGYYLAIFSELMLKEWQSSVLNVSEMYQQWHVAVAGLPESQRVEIEQKALALARQRPALPSLQRLSRRLGVQRCYRFLRAKLGRLRDLASGRPVYRDVFAAATATDDFLMGARRTLRESRGQVF